MRSSTSSTRGDHHEALMVFLGQQRAESIVRQSDPIIGVDQAKGLLLGIQPLPNCRAGTCKRTDQRSSQCADYRAKRNHLPTIALIPAECGKGQRYTSDSEYDSTYRSSNQHSSFGAAFFH